MSSNSGPICSRSCPRAESAIARTWRISPRSLATYSGRRSGPSTITAMTARSTNSQPLMLSSSTTRPLHQPVRRSVGRRLQGHPDSPLRPATTHGQLDAVADRPGPEADDELVGAQYGLAVELEDDVTGLQARLVGRAALGDGVVATARGGGDPHALALVGGVEHDADHRVRGLAGGDQLVGRLAGLVARDGEADADVAGPVAGAAAGHLRDGGVDADHPPGHVEQGAAGVARVDRGVGLDRVDEGLVAGL